MPLGGGGQNLRLRDFCHSLTLLPPGASVFHKHMSSFYLKTIRQVFTCMSEFVSIFRPRQVGGVGGWNVFCRQNMVQG